MSKLPILKARQLFKVLHLLGFQQTHRKGSHFFFHHEDGRTTVVPAHPTETLGKGLLRSVLRDLEISVDDLNRLLKK